MFTGCGDRGGAAVTPEQDLSTCSPKVTELSHAPERERCKVLDPCASASSGYTLVPVICPLYSAVSIFRMYGMMLSMGTLPMRPVKKSSSVMLELISLRAGSRTRIRASLQE
ncbi:hypothetical protein GDO81_024932 [Engystomops pustulosus]|uniref:Uncharacterized protein n=1 Tax=Engystomops pustulosus TaxID=76066 RepID=A0AAV6ZGX0_ENGPU|nr:hypothetical protein GDO81_024932 [Engystomops pustulosus]